jgi:hypothetical protein
MSRTATMVIKMMALPGRCAGPSRVVSWETSGCWQLSGGELRSRTYVSVENYSSIIVRQARRRCQRGTYVPMRWRAAPCRDRAHGRPREADADACPQGQQGTAGARALTVAPSRVDDGPSSPRSRAATGAAAMPARHACADALASSAAPGSGARQTARSRCGRLSARPARDCRCPRVDARPSPGRRRPVDASVTRCGRCGGDASEARMCRCTCEQRRAGIGRTADRAKPTRTKVRKASKGLPVPARRRSPRPGPTTARRSVDHALRQARRRCQRGTYVPMRWRAAPRRPFAVSAMKKGGRSPPDHFRMKAT